jgi:predicted DNA-binding transcriptional regulator YafY
LRNGFRHFRSDRISSLNTLEARYPTRRAVLMKTWRRENNLGDGA